MDEYRRHRRAFAFFRWLLTPLVKWRFNYSFDVLTGIEAPYLLLVNHNTDYDPILVGVAAGRQLYFVASEHVTRAGIFSKLLMRYFKPIIHTKGKTGAQSSIDTLRALRQGSSVCVFPEGNRSFNGLTGHIPPATGKLARRSGAALVTFRLRGGYFAQPRWGHGLRRGKISGELVHVYSPGELKAMTDGQVYSAICADLYEDAYATQRSQPVDFIGKNTAVGLETTLFTCPGCGCTGTLRSRGDALACSACGFSARYTPRGLLACPDGRELTITELDRLQRERLAAAAATGGDARLFSDEVTVNLIGADHSVVSSQSGLLSASPRGFSFAGRELALGDISGAAIYSRNSLVVHVGADAIHYEIQGAPGFSALKYLYLYRILKDRED